MRHACLLLLLLTCSCGDDSPPAASSQPAADPCIAIRSQYNQAAAIRGSAGGPAPALDLQLAEFMNRHWSCWH